MGPDHTCLISAVTLREEGSQSGLLGAGASGSWGPSLSVALHSPHQAYGPQCWPWGRTPGQIHRQRTEATVQTSALLCCDGFHELSQNSVRHWAAGGCESCRKEEGLCFKTKCGGHQY